MEGPDDFEEFFTTKLNKLRESKFQSKDIISKLELLKNSLKQVITSEHQQRCEEDTKFSELNAELETLKKEIDRKKNILHKHHEKIDSLKNEWDSINNKKELLKDKQCRLLKDKEVLEKRLKPSSTFKLCRKDQKILNNIQLRVQVYKVITGIKFTFHRDIKRIEGCVINKNSGMISFEFHLSSKTEEEIRNLLWLLIKKCVKKNNQLALEFNK